MEWTDEGIVLSARAHGETSAIVCLLTRDHGAHAGLVRGGMSQRRRGMLQPGNLLKAAWRARLPEHLGAFSIDLIRAMAAPFMDDPARLAAISAACAVSEAALPERDPHPAVFGSLNGFLQALGMDCWPYAYIEWEVALLKELGFGLDLTNCAATGTNDQLAYVSPKSGRAVSLSAGEPYKASLLALPQFLTGGEIKEPGDIANGLKLTGFFLDRHVFGHARKGIPPARQRLAARLRS